MSSASGRGGAGELPRQSSRMTAVEETQLIETFGETLPPHLHKLGSTFGYSTIFQSTTSIGSDKTLAVPHSRVANGNQPTSELTTGEQTAPEGMNLDANRNNDDSIIEDSFQPTQIVRETPEGDSIQQFNETESKGASYTPAAGFEDSESLPDLPVHDADIRAKNTLGKQTEVEKEALLAVKVPGVSLPTPASRPIASTKVQSQHHQAGAEAKEAHSSALERRDTSGKGNDAAGSAGKDVIDCTCGCNLDGELVHSLNPFADQLGTVADQQ